MGLEVVSDHDKWLSTLKEEEAPPLAIRALRGVCSQMLVNMSESSEAWKANRKERQELLRVVAQTSGPVEKEVRCSDRSFSIFTSPCRACPRGNIELSDARRLAGAFASKTLKF
ncbi:unnamed protein product [Symbiodinium natans]|uniref:Uncharacterized protein n=1 Tax=Symbiodinium natans TaxID=878477 RepID=A0A812J763_9DINO|nr:unnamed protein product [Symbiodinium natans]